MKSEKAFFVGLVAFFVLLCFAFDLIYAAAVFCLLFLLAFGVEGIS